MWKDRLDGLVDNIRPDGHIFTRYTIYMLLLY